MNVNAKSKLNILMLVVTTGTYTDVHCSMLQLNKKNILPTKRYCTSNPQREVYSYVYIIEWRDLALFCNFGKPVLCVRLGIFFFLFLFYWFFLFYYLYNITVFFSVQFLKNCKFGCACKAKFLFCKKSLHPSTYFL